MPCGGSASEWGGGSCDALSTTMTSARRLAISSAWERLKVSLAVSAQLLKLTMTTERMGRDG